MEIFGTPKPSANAVNKWKQSWRETNTRISIASFGGTRRFLIEAGIDPLLYQYAADSDDQFYVIFYKPEHELFFNLHSGLR